MPALIFYFLYIHFFPSITQYSDSVILLHQQEVFQLWENCHSSPVKYSTIPSDSLHFPPILNTLSLINSNWGIHFSTNFWEDGWVYSRQTRDMLQKMFSKMFPHSFQLAPLVLIAPLKTWETVLTWPGLGWHSMEETKTIAKTSNNGTMESALYMIQFKLSE